MGCMLVSTGGFESIIVNSEIPMLLLHSWGGTSIWSFIFSGFSFDNMGCVNISGVYGVPIKGNSNAPIDTLIDPIELLRFCETRETKFHVHFSR